MESLLCASPGALKPQAEAVLCAGILSPSTPSTEGMEVARCISGEVDLASAGDSPRGGLDSCLISLPGNLGVLFLAC